MASSLSLALLISILLLASVVVSFSPVHIRSTSAKMGEVPDDVGSMQTSPEATMSDAPEEEPKKLSKTAQKKAARKAARTNQEWKGAVEAFKAQVLDPAYLNPSIRSSVVDSAKDYPKSERSTQECLMPGTHKHLGGAYDPTDGCIYGVPANSKAVLCLYPVKEDGETVTSYEMRAIPLPQSIRDTKMKWLRGIFAHGYLWAIPAWADAVLCVDVDAYWGRREATGDIVQLIPLPEEHPTGMTWQWHGAGINKEETAIYCVPSNAQKVLKVDLGTKTTSLIPIDYDAETYPSFKLDLQNKFYGGIRGVDNKVYCVPYRSCAVLQIDCATDTARLVGPDYGTSGYNWHGGICVNGKIYAHPSHAPDTVLVINTNPDCPSDDICTELPIQRAEYDRDPRKNYKWLGGAVGADGNIYCPACDTSSVLKIDAKTDECTTFGFAGKLKNKWQGGILSKRDGCIYCIPADGHHILRIATSPDIEGENPIQLVGEVSKHKDKWQGGTEGLDGSLYFIPENGMRVMKVTPPSEPPTIIDGKLPENDVLVEMM